MTFKGRGGPACDVVLARCPISQSAINSDPAIRPLIGQRSSSIIHKSYFDVAVFSAFLGANLAISTKMHQMADYLAKAMASIGAPAVEDS